MKVVIVGAGAAGYTIAKQLIEENKDVILIEKDPATARNASKNLDCLVINGEGNNINVLKNAGVNKSDCFIALTDSDEINIITCGIVNKEFDVGCRIARVRNIDYFNLQIMNSEFSGIDFVVNPEVEAAKSIIRTIQYGAMSNIIDFEKSNIIIRNLLVDGNPFFNNKSVSEIKESINEEFLIAGIVRDEEFIIPSGNTEILENDTLYLIAAPETLEEIFAKVGQIKTKINKIILAGSGRICKFVADFFLPESKSTLFKWFSSFRIKKNKHKIVIIENNYEKCKALSDQLPQALVLNADISDEDIFEEEDLTNYDLIVTMTDDQELNILSALYAKTIGVKRAISVVNKNNFITMANKLGVDAVVSPVNSIVNPILKYLRKGNIRSFYNIADSGVEILEIFINPDSAMINKRLEDIKFPKNTLVLYVTRENNNFIPTGKFIIQDSDVLIIITHKEAVDKIEKLMR